MQTYRSDFGKTECISKEYVHILLCNVCTYYTEYMHILYGVYAHIPMRISIYGTELLFKRKS